MGKERVTEVARDYCGVRGNENHTGFGLTSTSPEGHLSVSGGKRKLGVNAFRTPNWGEAVGLIFRGSVSKFTSAPRGNESVGPAQVRLGGGACRDPENGGGAGRRGTGNSLAKTLSRPRATGGPSPTCSHPGRPQAPTEPRGAAYGVPGARQAHARAMAEVRVAAEPTGTLRGGGGAPVRAAAILRAAEHPRARARGPREKAARGSQEHDSRPVAQVLRHSPQPVRPAPGLGTPH